MLNMPYFPSVSSHFSLVLLLLVALHKASQQHKRGGRPVRLLPLKMENANAVVGPWLYHKTQGHYSFWCCYFETWWLCLFLFCCWIGHECELASVEIGGGARLLYPSTLYSHAFPNHFPNFCFLFLKLIQAIVS